MTATIAHRGLLLLEIDKSEAFVNSIMVDSPACYWRLNEASGSIAANQTGAFTGVYSSYATVKHSSGGPVAGGGYIDVSQPSGPDQTPGVNLVLNSNWTGGISCGMLVRVGVSQPAGLAHLISRNEYFASATSKFPIALVVTSDLKLRLRLSSGDDYAVDAVLESAVLTASTWYFVHFVYRPNGLCQLFINGAVVDSETIAFIISNSDVPWRLGSSVETSGGIANSTANASFSEVALYDSPLSTGQALAQYESWQTNA